MYYNINWIFYFQILKMHKFCSQSPRQWWCNQLSWTSKYNKFSSRLCNSPWPCSNNNTPVLIFNNLLSILVLQVPRWLKRSRVAQLRVVQKLKMVSDCRKYDFRKSVFSWWSCWGYQVWKRVLLVWFCTHKLNRFWFLSRWKTIWYFFSRRSIGNNFLVESCLYLLNEKREKNWRFICFSVDTLQSYPSKN